MRHSPARSVQVLLKNVMENVMFSMKGRKEIFTVLVMGSVDIIRDALISLASKKLEISLTVPLSKLANVHPYYKLLREYFTKCPSIIIRVMHLIKNDGFSQSPGGYQPSDPRLTALLRLAQNRLPSPYGTRPTPVPFWHKTVLRKW